jgi:hypothetical protein
MGMDFKRTGNADFPDRLKVLISGSPKSGKTTLLGTVPNIVIADTEPFANNLQSVSDKNIPYVTITALEDLKSLLIVLGDEHMRAKAASELGMPSIDAVAIDTLDTLQQIMKAERMKDQRQTQFLRDDWGWLKEEMTSILRAFTALPLHVFFIVHTKTQEIGRGDDIRTVVLPGLQGSIAEDIAGMVGYSLMTFRKQEVRADGSPYTKYWLRAEGDETYAFLGNRAAGRLPDIIEPSFSAIYEAAMAGAGERTSVETSPSVSLATVVMGSGAAITAAVETATKPPAADEPVNAAALTHTKKVYDAIGVTFPEDIIKGLTMGQAREMVKMWQACQQDEAEGKLTEGATAVITMKDYLVAMGWVADESVAEVLDEGPKKLDITGNVDSVLSYVVDDTSRAQEAYDAEVKRSSPRSTLLSALVDRGAKAPVVNEAAKALDDDEVAPPEVKATVMEAAVATAEEVLGASVIDTMNADGSDEKVEPCEECGGEIDDVDIAVLSRTRFKRWLCVNDYIKQTKTPAQV